MSHALILTYARTLPRPEGALLRLATYLTGLARAESERGSAGFTRLHSERSHVLELLGTCQRQPVDQAAFELLWAFDDYFRLQGYQVERRLALAMGLTLARASNNRQQEANCIKALERVS